MDTLISEDLLLLLLDDDGTTSSGVPIGTVLGGALLVDLSLAEAVHVGPADKKWSRAKVLPVDGAAPGDPVLADALATVAEKPRSAQDLVDRLGKDVKDRLADRLVERGLLERRDTKVLGLFHRSRWPAADSAHEADVRRQVSAALVQGTTPDQRTAALISLLSAVGQAHQVVDRDQMPAKQVKARAREIADGDWAASAVRDSIAAAMAATTAAVTAATVATTTTITN